VPITGISHEGQRIVQVRGAPSLRFTGCHRGVQWGWASNGGERSRRKTREREPAEARG